MANGGTWNASSLPVRPGLYINFREAALAAIQGGSRGTVAIPIFTYAGTAQSGKFYTVESVAEGIGLVGEANATPITCILEGGAKEVLVYAVPPKGEEETDAAQYANMREEFAVQDFNVFVYPTIIDVSEQTATQAWVKNCREEGKHFTYVAGGNAAADADIEQGNARSILLKDEYIVNLVTGVVLADGTAVQSADYASYIAGLIAGTPINQSITYKELPVIDVTKRLKNSEITNALISGSLVLVKDGNSVLIEQGITTDSNAQARGKIRKARVKQAIATDLPAAARANYIGKVDNEPNGQAALIAAFKTYLETLESENVLLDPEVALDTRYPSTGDQVFIAVEYTEVDSMERIFMTITTR